MPGLCIYLSINTIEKRYNWYNNWIHFAYTIKHRRWQRRDYSDNNGNNGDEERGEEEDGKFGW